MRDLCLANVQEAQEFEKVSAGGYICGITAVEDVADKEYLKIEYDIAEGTLKNYYRNLYDSKGFWGARLIKSYKEKALPFFKAFITAVENSNAGFKFDNDEKKLVRKFVGFVLAEEEYKANDGTIKTRLYVDQVHTADRIRKGDFKVPPLKKLAVSTNGQASANLSDFEEIVTTDGVPF